MRVNVQVEFRKSGFSDKDHLEPVPKTFYVCLCVLFCNMEMRPVLQGYCEASADHT